MIAIIYKGKIITERKNMKLHQYEQLLHKTIKTSNNNNRKVRRGSVGVKVLSGIALSEK